MSRYITDRHDPIAPITSPVSGIHYLGLTKREEFAKAAMIGLLADPEDHEDVRQWGWQLHDGTPCDGICTQPKKQVYTETCAQAVARLAVEQADALIEALNNFPKCT